MGETVFAAHNLTKQYKQFLALDHVNMEIKRGDIYGFVGENGAGKTTLIRVLAGVANKSGGEISLFGVNEPSLLSKQLRRTGGIIENPVIYPDMNANENLEVCRLQRGIKDKSSIKRVLELVKLADTGKKKAKNFSLGMRQRLGLAMALLSEPEFLILDEPVNGLDPTGIVEFRELIKHLNSEKGITVLISSHILGELYQLATCYGFIHKGKLIEQISYEELNNKCKKHLYIRVDDAKKAAEVLKNVLHSPKLELVSGNVIQLYDAVEQSGEIVKALVVDGGVTLSEITTKGDDLEKYYMSLIGGQEK